MMCTLSDNAISEILRHGRIYEVGGAVRDRFLSPSRRIKDRDYLVTGVPYEELTKILRRFGRVDLVGRSFGVIKFTEFRAERAHTFDIALPRREFSTGTGHRDFTVDFDPSIAIEDDLKRRDFTINAMALALDNDELVDPLGGRVDLDKRQIRMTSAGSFDEDPLRMLRAIQFAARFSFSIEDDTLKAISAHAELISHVSAERVAEEINKLLMLADAPSGGFRAMQSTGLLEHFLPELSACVHVEQPGGFHKYDVFEHTIRCVDACPPRLRLRLAALFHDIRKPQHRRLTDTGATFYGHEVSGARQAKKILARLRYPKHISHDVAVLVERHMFTSAVTDKGLRRLIRRVGSHLIFDLMDLRRADVIAQGMGGTTEDIDEMEQRIRDELHRKPPLTYSDLAIDGHDVMTMFDLAPGPEIGRILEYLLEQVIDNPEVNIRGELEERARDFFARENQSGDRETDEERES